MKRREFVRTAGFGSLAAIAGRALAGPTPSGETSAPAPRPSTSGGAGTSSALEALRPPPAVWKARTPALVDAAERLMRGAASDLGGFVRGLPQSAGSDRLDDAFGGALRNRLRASLPAETAQFVPYLRSQWRRHPRRAAFDDLAAAADVNAWIRKAAAAAGLPWEQAEVELRRFRELAPARFDTGPVPRAADDALSALGASKPLKSVLDAMKAAADPPLADPLEWLRFGYAALAAEPQAWGDLIEASFGASAGLVAPAAAALDLGGAASAGRPAMASEAAAPARAQGGGDLSVEDKIFVFFVILSEIPCNVLVIAFDCGETAYARSPDRLELLLEAESLLLSYGGGFGFGRPPLHTYSNAFWSLTSFGSDMVMDFLKRNKRKLLDMPIEMLWGFVGCALLYRYLHGLDVGAGASGRGIVPAMIPAPTADDNSTLNVALQTSWTVTTKILCRWAVPMKSPKYWSIVWPPAVWLSVYLIGCTAECAMWASDVVDARTA